MTVLYCTFDVYDLYKISYISVSFGFVLIIYTVSEVSYVDAFLNVLLLKLLDNKKKMLYR